MKRWRRWSLEETAACRAMWEDGVPLGEIATALGRTVDAVRARLAQPMQTDAISRRGPRRPDVLNSWDRGRIREMFRKWGWGE